MNHIDVSTLTRRPLPTVFTGGRTLVLLVAAALFLPALALAQPAAQSAAQPAAQPTAAATGPAGSWTLADIAARALEADPAVRSSRALAGIASTQYELELDKARPKLNLALTPLSWDDRRVPAFTGGPSSYEDARALSLGGGLNLSQALPSAGLLSAGARTQFRITDPLDDIGFALAPALSASLRQPLWAGGELLPFAAADATRRSAQITASQAALDDRSRRNQAVRAAVESAGRVLVLRKNLAVQQTFLAAALGRAEALDLRRSVGTATEDAALELALTAELARQALLDIRLALQDAERRLASVLGLNTSAGTGATGAALLPQLSEALPKLPPASLPGLHESPDVARAVLGVEKTLADSAARATLDAPVLGASVLLEPRYRDKRADTSSLPSAFTDFFDYGDKAGVNWNLSLSLDIPLTARAARNHRSNLDSLALDAAEAQRIQTELAVGDRAAALAERRDALGERLRIQRRIAALEVRKADRLDDLAIAGTVPREDAADARAELDRDLAEILRLELDLLLTELDLRSLAGMDLATVIASGY
jgi:outer membrane protein TolC